MAEPWHATLSWGNQSKVWYGYRNQLLRSRGRGLHRTRRWSRNSSTYLRNFSSPAFNFSRTDP